MDRQKIGFLHPGEMGISLAATVQNTGHAAHWLSMDRSRNTKERASRYNLTETRTMEEFCATCDLIVCVCPPHAATEVAEQILACSFKGVYADVNAISPQRVMAIEQSMTRTGVRFVDGGIIGGPAWKPDSTWLYLSGDAADFVAACFADGPLATEVIGDEVGKASALKMCFAANTKGTTAMRCAIVAAAEEMGVRGDLERQWSRHGSDFAAQVRSSVTGVTGKAWRFSGEMEEIASTLGAAGLPEGFHLAAAEVYERMAGFKDAGQAPSVEEVIDALLRNRDVGNP